MVNKKTEWLDTNEYPFNHHFQKINNQNLHYIDEGSGEIILFVHGTPSWSFDFRHLIKDLSMDHRCIAIDHIGFGLSDKPKDYNYSTHQHSRTLEEFIFRLELNQITLVVHDFGGPIALRFAIDHPEKIKRLIILNSWLWSSEDEPDFKRLKKILKSPILPFLYKRLNFSAAFIMPRSFASVKLSKSLQKQYTAPFENASQREGTLAFAYSLLNDQEEFESLWLRRQRISDKATLFIWGIKDPVISPSYLHKFESGFQHSETVELNDCGHFPQEEKPQETVTAIRNFLSKNP